LRGQFLKKTAERKERPENVAWEVRKAKKGKRKENDIPEQVLPTEGGRLNLGRAALR